MYVFTNAERVDLYKNDVFVTTLHKSGWTALPHPPPVSYTHLLEELIREADRRGIGLMLDMVFNHTSVSYTHLDVYKRQAVRGRGCACQN